MMRIICAIVVLILFVNVTVFSQSHIQKDTSFTLHSTFLKEKKRRPYITIANPVISHEIQEKSNIIYDYVNNRPLQLDVFYPQSDSNEKFPGVLLIHGGGWQSGDKTQMYAIAKYLASKGYVAVTPEYSLSAEAKYPEAVYNLKIAVGWMRRNAKEINLNPQKIASLGTSAGGQLATLLGVTNGKKNFERKFRRKNLTSIQAIVNIDGVLAFRHPESSEGKSAAFWLGGMYENNPENWEEASPINHVSRKTPPVLFINSSIPRFHAGRDDMIKKMNNYKIYSEVYELPDTPHTFWFFNPWFQPMMNYTVQFLDKIFKK